MIPDSSPVSLPVRLARLEELATDLWWSWHPEARSVFRRLDYGLWRATAHNPLRMVRLISRAKLDCCSSGRLSTASFIASGREITGGVRSTESVGTTDALHIGA